MKFKIGKYIGKKGLFLVVIALFMMLLMVVAGCSKRTPANVDPNYQIKLYKSEQCGCCGLYGQYLEKKDYAIEVVEMENIDPIKDKFGVPKELWSCHTAEIGGYFVEGHIPTEAIEKLMKEKPDIAGIAMPGMPSGSPGMPGAKNGDFVIFTVARDGSVSEFMRI